MSKSLRETIELIALKKKINQKTPEIVVNLQHSDGTNPKLYWDILVVNFFLVLLLNVIIENLCFVCCIFIDF